MKQLEFTVEMQELVAEWQREYQMHRANADDPENWPDDRDQEDWIGDFFVWLQCKGYTV